MKIYTEEELINFENEIISSFNSGAIRAPIHLSNGYEKELISIFEDISEEDWVFCTWRSHYHCLLKGVPQSQLKKDIIDGKSISLCYSKYNIYSSAIVTGSIPIATGVALDIKKKKKSNKVWCFLGDMASETGVFFENWKYAVNFDLPITYIIEDNNKSVCTDTRKTWNCEKLYFEGENPKIKYFQYSSIYPHAGAGKRIQF